MSARRGCARRATQRWRGIWRGFAGQVRDVLTESPRMGRTECFAEVRFATDQPVGGIVRTRLGGVAGAAVEGVAV